MPFSLTIFCNLPLWMNPNTSIGILAELYNIRIPDAWQYCPWYGALQMCPTHKQRFRIAESKFKEIKLVVYTLSGSKPSADLLHPHKTISCSAYQPGAVLFYNISIPQEMTGYWAIGFTEHMNVVDADETANLSIIYVFQVSRVETRNHHWESILSRIKRKYLQVLDSKIMNQVHLQYVTRALPWIVIRQIPLQNLFFYRPS